MLVTKAMEDWEIVKGQSRQRRHGNYRQHGILDKILEQKKDFGTEKEHREKNGKMLIKFVV